MDQIPAIEAELARLEALLLTLSSGTTSFPAGDDATAQQLAALKSQIQYLVVVLSQLRPRAN